jgi:hypothetical protein
MTVLITTFAEIVSVHVATIDIHGLIVKAAFEVYGLNEWICGMFIKFPEIFQCCAPISARVKSG